MNTLSEESFNATVEIIIALIKAISLYPDGLPSGHLYAHVIGHMSLQQYQAIVDIMIESGRVKKHGDLLFAT